MRQEGVLYHLRIYECIHIEYTAECTHRPDNNNIIINRQFLSMSLDNNGTRMVLAMAKNKQTSQKVTNYMIKSIIT